MRETAVNMKTLKVAAAIIQDGDRILSCQRGYGEFKGGWEFPGGKFEPGESGEQAIAREILEELHVAIEDISYLCTAEHDYPTFHISMDCFTCRIARGTIDDTEHEDMRWLSRDELWSVDWLPVDVLVVKELEKRFA